MIILRRIAAVENFDRGEEFGFPIASLLARRALGCPGEKDRWLMEETLSLIEQRVDCADFLVCGLLRYLKKYALPEDPLSPDAADPILPPGLLPRVRHVLLNWRYWMDQEGFDGMCFWSENHCLMFYSAAMTAGALYPEDRFPRAGKTGKELSAWGREKILEWLADVEAHGFEEFQSTVYTCVTFAALLNVVDFAARDIALRAAKVTDRLLETLALHTFRGGIISPQGRVYRDVIYPFRAGAMALMNLADPSQPWSMGEGWLSFHATSRYLFPSGLKKLMTDEVSLSYTSGNARIILEKHPDWCLTSIQSPRESFSRWENTVRAPEADPSSHAFVKSFNECFHGTTCFQPGVFGYQQHLWSAALSGEAAIFINHPGATSEGGDMRPGYWHGSGVFPAMKQEGALLGMIWRIPESHPLHYIHLYCPECRFDRILDDGDWLLLQRDQGYIGLWTSRPRAPWSGLNFRVEQRILGSEIACLCVCAGREIPDLEAFREKVRSLRPAYHPELHLLAAEGYELGWQQGRDDTQYL